ncbi:MAG: preprotein translocase subunit SecA [Actinobacteria bacterium RBG_16_64_13]|nr:MAG: preprotein translocase subunit SecA [Actinobacteria bacterium RBG_16_64_13]
MIKVVDKVLRFGEGKKLRQLEATVAEVAAWESEIAALSDEALRAKTVEFRGRLTNGETLDDLLPEAFAVAREAARRTTGMRPFDVQVMGAVVLHQGSIAEMKTGEGKTLVATMPVYLNALAGRGVHLVTVNDYLAGRDAAWMGPVYEFLGLSVAALQNSMPEDARREAYRADVTYGTNTEFGFDYLRDNMVLRTEQQVQRGHSFCIVDEVDSILVDEARTPLIISGPGERAAKTYYDFARIARRLTPGESEEADYEIDEKKRTVAITEKGLARVERELGLDNIYEDLSGQLVNHLMQALKAAALFKRDVDYLVQDGEVKIIDEFTGRILEGRRYSEGLHQAIEAREGVKIKEENQTLATITLQNYFRLYEKIGGMTGTAATEADEFREIYKMEVVVIPTNEPMIRDDGNDLIYKTEKAKFKAAADLIADCYERKQPVLVGTISVEKSERLAEMLKRRGIPHEVLNAKHHAKEAGIIAQAGQPGSITIATNMAGRGTDIRLGEGVVEVGGLFVLGTERHEARRVDNQLRGRSGRQGDPGASRFIISLEDDLLRIFGGDRIHHLMDRLGLDEDTPIEHSLISRSVESAQKKVEEQNFEIRKRVLEYDDVMNLQREVIYGQRQRILQGDDLKEDVLGIIERILRQQVAFFTGSSRFSEEWDLEELLTMLRTFFPATLTVESLGDPTELDAEEVADMVVEDALRVYEAKEERFGAQAMRALEGWVLLRTIDSKWRDHLYEMDYLREGIGLRALAQRDPLVEYKNEGYKMFQELMESIQEDFVRYLYHLEIAREEQPQEAAGARGLAYSGGGDSSLAQNFAGAAAARSAGVADSSAEAYEAAQRATRTVVAPRSVTKGGRNDACPCGSGRKYKKCCGA